MTDMNTRANMGAIFLYKLATEDNPAEGPTQLTEGHSNCWNPVWTPSALFFLSDREFRKSTICVRNPPQAAVELQEPL